MDKRIYKLTANRKLILRLLGDYIDGSSPPHSASNILYALENAVKYGWQGYESLKTVPQGAALPYLA
ncbi:hypothetical protein [Methyloglobulus sp.]|uniref:hypothetical protein n=1 Tax=Methyloglobulus sp. TaxID=2518622 RepID=UPI0032B70F03